MEAILIRDQGVWDTAVAALPYAHVLQSWAWGEIKARHGWTPTRVLFIEGNVPRAAAQILRRPLPRTPFGVMYVPKGPVLPYDDAALFTRVLDGLERAAREQNAIFIKADPDVRANDPAAAALSVRGWRVSDEQIQFHNTVILDLAKPEAELLAAMKPKWRYNLRLAEKRGVKVVEGEQEDLQTLYDMYVETGARDGFVIRSYDYYRDVWTTMLRAKQAKLLLARVGAETVAGILLFLFGKRAWYFYGASRSAHRDLMPNHLLQWKGIYWAKAHGCTEYDFWGAPDVLSESAPMYGVYKFKMGFGGEFVERVPAHDFVVNRALYWLYAEARPRYLARLRRPRAGVSPE